MREPVLQAMDISKRYGPVLALSEVSFSVPSGSITAFLGENGAGKTTAVKILLGFLRPDSGRVVCRRPHVGFVPERPAFFPWFRGRDVIDLTAGAFGIGPAETERRIRGLGDRLGFDPGLAARRVSGYSPGNQKKLSYLQNLLVSPELLLVDEPFSSLDPHAIRSVRELFMEHRLAGGTLLLSSHLISELEKVCDRIIILQRGRVLIEEDLERLREDFRFVRSPAGRGGSGMANSPVLDVPATWIRDTPEGSIALAKVSGAERLAAGVSTVDSITTERLTLESLYFFFTSYGARRTLHPLVEARTRRTSFGPEHP